LSASGQDGTGFRLTSLWSRARAPWLARAVAPERDDDALARGLQRLHVRRHGLEHVAAGLGTLGREIVALLGADIDHRALLVRHRKRRQPRQPRAVEALAPFWFGQVEAIGGSGRYGGPSRVPPAPARAPRSNP